MHAANLYKLASLFLKLSEDLAQDEVRIELQNKIEWEAFWAIKDALIKFKQEAEGNAYISFIRESYTQASKLEDKLYEWLSDNNLQNEHNKSKIFNLLNIFYKNLKFRVEVMQGNFTKNFSNDQEFNELLIIFQELIYVLNTNLDILANIDQKVNEKIEKYIKIDWRPEEGIEEDHYAL